MARCEVRPGCLGLYQVFKTSRAWRSHNVSRSDVLTGKNLLLIRSLNFSFQLTPLASHLPSTHWWKSLAPSSRYIPYRQGTAAVRCPRAVSSPDWTSPFPQPLLTIFTASAVLNPVCWSLSYIEGPKLDAGSIGLHRCHGTLLLMVIHCLPGPAELLPGQAAAACTTAREEPSTTTSPSSLRCSSGGILKLTKSPQNCTKSFQGLSNSKNKYFWFILTKLSQKKWNIQGSLNNNTNRK